MNNRTHCRCVERRKTPMQIHIRPGRIWIIKHIANLWDQKTIQCRRTYSLEDMDHPARAEVRDLHILQACCEHIFLIPRHHHPPARVQHVMLVIKIERGLEVDHLTIRCLYRLYHRGENYSAIYVTKSTFTSPNEKVREQQTSSSSQGQKSALRLAIVSQIRHPHRIYQLEISSPGWALASLLFRPTTVLTLALTNSYVFTNLNKSF